MLKLKDLFGFTGKELGGFVAGQGLAALPGIGASLYSDFKRQKQERRAAKSAFESDIGQVESMAGDLLAALQEAANYGVVDETTPKRIKEAKEVRLGAIRQQYKNFGF